MEILIQAVFHSIGCVVGVYTIYCIYALLNDNKKK